MGTRPPYFGTGEKKPERVVETDVPLTKEEALEIATQLETWPPGMGWVLQRDETKKRGWVRHKTYRPFDKEIPPLSDDVKHCPVVTLKLMRGESGFGPHLAAFRVLRNAIAEQQELSLERAREVYNELLKTHPEVLAALFRRYAR